MTNLVSFLRTFAVAAAGGYLFTLLGLPLPWMLGAMLFTALASGAGLSLRIDMRLRRGMIIVLGVMLGSAFSPEILEKAGAWSISLAGLVAYVAVAGLGAAFIYRRFFGTEATTSYFSGVPGGLTEMIILGGKSGGDERTISLAHTTRLFFVIMVIPIWFQFFAGGYSPEAREHAVVNIADQTILDLAILAVSGVVGWLLAQRSRLPGAELTGPAIASATVHLVGWTSAPPPQEVVALAQIVIGASIGCRFAGITMREFVVTVRNAVVVSAGLIAVSAAFATILMPLTGLSFGPLFLAYAPGGIAEMSLVALALNIDAAFVATHHISRIAIVLVLAPLGFRILQQVSRGKE